MRSKDKEIPKMIKWSRNTWTKFNLERKAIRVDTMQRNSLCSQKRIRLNFHKESGSRILKVSNGCSITTIKDV